jgi:hypothetical protein
LIGSTTPHPEPFAWRLLCCCYIAQFRGVLFFAVFLVASFDLIRSISSNPFQVLRVQAFAIGKNDFFLAAAVKGCWSFAGRRLNAARHRCPAWRLQPAVAAPSPTARLSGAHG